MPSVGSNPTLSANLSLSIAYMNCVTNGVTIDSSTSRHILQYVTGCGIMRVMIIEKGWQ